MLCGCCSYTYNHPTSGNCSLPTGGTAHGGEVCSVPGTQEECESMLSYSFSTHICIHGVQYLQASGAQAEAGPSPGDMQQCLGTFLIVTTWRRGGAAGT